MSNQRWDPAREVLLGIGAWRAQESGVLSPPSRPRPLPHTQTRPLPRLLEPTLVDRLQRFPVVVVTGARQTGKTTLVQAFPRAGERRFLTLDSLSVLDRARTAPEVLVHESGWLTLDEIQRVPDLLLVIKHEVDRDRRPGRFLLTGSANLLLLSSVSESLAGRAVHLVLRPMTEREKRGERSRPGWGALLAASGPRDALSVIGRAQAFDWRAAALAGGFPPAALAADPVDRALWFEGYVDTYVQRDLHQLAQVGDLPAFLRLAKLAALRNGGLLNHAELARDAGLSRTTVQRWLSILEASFLVTALQPLAESRAKRLIKTPKLYFGDTGLGLHLSDVEAVEALERTMASGTWLEGIVLNELLAWRETEIKKPGDYFQRSVTGEEVDFVIEHRRRLLPIEVKSASTVRVQDARALDRFSKEFGARAPFGVLLYGGTETVQLTERTIAIPLGGVL